MSDFFVADTLNDIDGDTKHLVMNVVDTMTSNINPLHHNTQLICTTFHVTGTLLNPPTNTAILQLTQLTRDLKFSCIYEPHWKNTPVVRPHSSS